MAMPTERSIQARIWTPFALAARIGILLLLFLVPGAVSAAPTAQLTWISTTGTGATGGSTIEAMPGDVLTLQVAVVAEEIAVVLYSLSPSWDTTGTDVLNFMSESLQPVPDSWVEFGGAANMVESSGGSPGAIESWTEPADLFALNPLANTEHFVGTIQFLVINNGAATVDWGQAGSSGAPSFILDEDGGEHFLNGASQGFVTAEPRPRSRYRVELCHKVRRTIRVSARAIPAHMRHGDTLGACE